MTHTLIAIMLVMGAATADSTSQPAAGGVIRATGVGYPPGHMTGGRARLMARRAAEVVAVRNLAVKLSGRQPQTADVGSTYSRLNTTIQGFRYLPPRHLPDGSVEVTVEMSLTSASSSSRRAGAEPPAAQSGPGASQPTHPVSQIQAHAFRFSLERVLERLEQTLAEIRSILAKLPRELSDVDARPAGAPVQSRRRCLAEDRQPN